jgi:hypothetical protein
MQNITEHGIKEALYTIFIDSLSVAHPRGG